MRAVFMMPIPKGTSDKKAKRMAEEDEPHMKKPDLDNLLKWIKDVCNGIVWHDDGQVCQVFAEKHYSLRPATRVEIEEWSRNSF